MTSRRPLWLSAALMLATVAAGLAIRFVHAGLPWTVMKYGGSALWAVMVYWIVSSFAWPRTAEAAALLAGCVATAVEFFKLVHTPALDAFRLTLPGIILLGRFFSWWDVLVYWIAVGAGYTLERMLRNS